MFVRRRHISPGKYAIIFSVSLNFTPNKLNVKMARTANECRTFHSDRGEKNLNGMVLGIECACDVPEQICTFY